MSPRKYNAMADHLKEIKERVVIQKWDKDYCGVVKSLKPPQIDDWSLPVSRSRCCAATT